MEGRERMLYAGKVSKLKLKLKKIFKCCQKKDEIDILFKNKYLIVKPTIEPELLIWKNFGITRK
jgi:hypothetical protein